MSGILRDPRFTMADFAELWREAVPPEKHPRLVKEAEMSLAEMFQKYFERYHKERRIKAATGGGCHLQLRASLPSGLKRYFADHVIWKKHSVSEFLKSYSGLWNCPIKCARKFSSSFSAAEECSMLPSITNPVELYAFRLNFYFAKTRRERLALLQERIKDYVQALSCGRKNSWTAARGPKRISSNVILPAVPPRKERFMLLEWRGGMDAAYSVCRACFCYIHATSLTQLKNMIKAVASRLAAPRPSISAQSLEEYERRSVISPHGKAAVVLAAVSKHLHVTIQDIPNKREIQAAETQIIGLFSNVMCQLPKHAHVEISYFRKLIQTHFPNLKLTQVKKFAKCHLCFTLSVLGVRLVRGSSEEEWKEFLEWRTRHAREHRAEREELMALRRAAVKAPERLWYLMLDGMTQNTTRLPKVFQATKAIETGAWPLELTAVAAWGSPLALAFYCSLPTVNKNANHTVTILQHYLSACRKRLEQQVQNEVLPANSRATPMAYECASGVIGSSVLPRYELPDPKSYSESAWRSTQMLSDYALINARKANSAHTKPKESSAPRLPAIASPRTPLSRFGTVCSQSDDMSANDDSPQWTEKERSMYHRATLSLSEQSAKPAERFPDKLVLQVDGGSENKNKVLFAFLALLVATGVFKQIEVVFLMVGHTHDLVDQLFSVVAHYLLKKNCWTPALFVYSLRLCYRKVQTVATSIFWVRHLINAKMKLESLGKDFKQMREFHRFLIEKETVAVSREVIPRPTDEKRPLQVLPKTKELITIKAKSTCRMDSEKGFQVFRQRVEDSAPPAQREESDLDDEESDEPHDECNESQSGSGKGDKPCGVPGYDITGTPPKPWERWWSILDPNELPEDVWQIAPDKHAADAVTKIQEQLQSVFRDATDMLMPEECIKEWDEFLKHFNQHQREFISCKECAARMARMAEIERPSQRERKTSKAARDQYNKANRQLSALYKEAQECMLRFPAQHGKVEGWLQSVYSKDDKARSANAPDAAVPKKSPYSTDPLIQHVLRTMAAGGGALSSLRLAAQKSGNDKLTSEVLNTTLNTNSLIGNGAYVFVLSPALFTKSYQNKEEWNSVYPFSLFRRCTGETEDEDECMAEHNDDGNEITLGDLYDKHSHDSQRRYGLSGMRLRRAVNSDTETKEWQNWDPWAEYCAYRDNPSVAIFAELKKRKKQAYDDLADDVEGKLSFVQWLMRWRIKEWRWTAVTKEQELSLAIASGLNKEEYKKERISEMGIAPSTIFYISAETPLKADGRLKEAVLKKLTLLLHAYTLTAERRDFFSATKRFESEKSNENKVGEEPPVAATVAGQLAENERKQFNLPSSDSEPEGNSEDEKERKELVVENERISKRGRQENSAKNTSKRGKRAASKFASKSTGRRSGRNSRRHGLQLQSLSDPVLQSKGYPQLKE